MVVDLLLKDGIVIVSGTEVVRSVAIQADKIEGIYEPQMAPPAKETIDCHDTYILPGIIDIHVHLRDLRQSEKEDYRSGTMAAAAGGVTTVVDMPNSDPPVLSMEVLEDKIEQARSKRFVNVGFYAGIPKRVSSFDDKMVDLILGLKEYPHAPLSTGTSSTTSRIRSCMSLAARHQIPLLFHPDSSTPSSKTSTMAEYLEAHSCEGELESVRRFVQARAEVGGHLHVCHVSCATTARFVLENRSEDTLTAEVTPHHLFLNASQFSYYDGIAKVLPPLRSPYDNQTLLDMLCGRCAIDCVASDHAPHTDEEKLRPFLSAPSGVVGLETTVPLLLTAVFEKRLSWVDYLRVCCSAPASIIGLSSKGILAPRYDADIIIVEKVKYQIEGRRFFSKAKTTPFEGQVVLARPLTTIVGGEVVYDHGKFVIGPGVAGRVPVRKY